MKKIKIITLILACIFISILIFTINSDSYALSDGLQGINEIVQGEGSVGDSLNLMLDDMEESNNTYCLSHGQRFWNSLGRKPFTIKLHLVIEGTVATDDYGNSVDNINNKILAAILEPGSGYGKWTGNIDGYTTEQLAIYLFFDTWQKEVGQQFGLDSSWGNNSLNYGDRASEVAIYYNNLCNELIAGANPGPLDVYFLESGMYNWQKLIIAAPRQKKPTPGLTIEKVNEKDQPMAGVKFIIEIPKKGYIKEDGEELKTTEDRSQAKIYVTDGAGEIHLNVLPGIYKAIEIENPNEGYEKNVGKSGAVQILNGESGGTIRIVNLPEEEITPNPGDSNTEGTSKVEISGTVWEEDFAGKGNSIDGKHGAGDKGVEGVTVTWKSGDQILGRTTTGSDGTYKLEYKESMFKMTDPVWYDKSKYELISNSYVEFEYNGLKYTTIAYNKEEVKDTSKAQEIKNYRDALDNDFKEISKDTVQEVGIPLTYTQGEDAHTSVLTDDMLENDKFVVKATTQGVLTKLIGELSEEQNNTPGRYTIISDDKYEGTTISKSGHEYCIQHCYQKTKGYWQGVGGTGEEWKGRIRRTCGR